MVHALGLACDQLAAIAAIAIHASADAGRLVEVSTVIARVMATVNLVAPSTTESGLANAPVIIDTRAVAVAEVAVAILRAVLHATVNTLETIIALTLNSELIVSLNLDALAVIAAFIRAAPHLAAIAAVARVAVAGAVDAHAVARAVEWARRRCAPDPRIAISAVADKVYGAQPMARAAERAALLSAAWPDIVVVACAFSLGALAMVVALIWACFASTGVTGKARRTLTNAADACATTVAAFWTA